MNGHHYEKTFSHRTSSPLAPLIGRLPNLRTLAIKGVVKQGILRQNAEAIKFQGLFLGAVAPHSGGSGPLQSLETCQYIQISHNYSGIIY
jgi:hypothetical protein